MIKVVNNRCFLRVVSAEGAQGAPRRARLCGLRYKMHFEAQQKQQQHYTANNNPSKVQQQVLIRYRSTSSHQVL